jgi:hypothetical protein
MFRFNSARVSAVRCEGFALLVNAAIRSTAVR